VLDLLHRENFAGRVMIESFDWENLALVQKQAPAIPTAYLTQLREPDANIYSTGLHRGPQDSIRTSTVAQSRARLRAAGGAIWSPFYRRRRPKIDRGGAQARAQGPGLDREQP